MYQSPTSFWHSWSPFARPYTVSITFGPWELHSFSTLWSLFTVTRESYMDFTTSISLQHFQKFCKGFYVANGGSMISTITHVALQTLSILCGPLHSTLLHRALFHIHVVMAQLKIFIYAYWSLSDLILALSQPTHNCMVAIEAQWWMDWRPTRLCKI